MKHAYCISSKSFTIRNCGFNKFGLFSNKSLANKRWALSCHLSSSMVSKEITNLMADDGRRPGVLDIPGFGVESTRIRDFYPAKYKVAHFIWIWVRWDLSILLPSRPLFSGPKTVQASVTLLEQLPTFLEKSYRCFFLQEKKTRGWKYLSVAQIVMDSARQ